MLFIGIFEKITLITLIQFRTPLESTPPEILKAIEPSLKHDTRSNQPRPQRTSPPPQWERGRRSNVISAAKVILLKEFLKNPLRKFLIGSCANESVAAVDFLTRSFCIFFRGFSLNCCWWKILILPKFKLDYSWRF